MTSCMAASATAIAISSIDIDKCYVCAFSDRTLNNLSQRLGESYDRMPLNRAIMQKACAAFSADGQVFAYNTNKGKLLSIWNTADWSLTENKTMLKHATNLVFSPKTNAIVVGDKKGNVYAFGDKGEQGMVRVLGHSSMVLGICFTQDEKYIATSDSDEKVRVSHYPDGKNILYYMMGHEAYVSSICSLDNNLLLSASGDCTLRLWNLDTGGFVHKLSLDDPIQSIVQVKDVVAVQMFNCDELYLVKIEKNKNRYTIKTAEILVYKHSVLNLAAYDNQLWLMTTRTVLNYTIDSTKDTIISVNDNRQIQRKLSNLVKTFDHTENTDLMIYLFTRMIERQRRV